MLNSRFTKNFRSNFSGIFACFVFNYKSLKSMKNFNLLDDTEEIWHQYIRFANTCWELAVRYI